MNILVIEHAEGRAEGLCFEAEKYRTPYQIWRPYRGESLNTEVTDFDGVIVGGGPMGAYELDKYPFFKDELEFIEHALYNNVPTLGICLGAQIIAKMLGCEVRKTYWRRGYLYIESVTDNKEDELFHNIHGMFPVFQYHQDEIMQIPPNSKLILTSDNCEVEGFKLNYHPVWAIQAHPEIGLNKATAILQSIPSLTATDLEDLLKAHGDTQVTKNSKIFENFFAFCANV